MKLEVRIYFFYKWRVQNSLNYICCNLWIDFLCKNLLVFFNYLVRNA